MPLQLLLLEEGQEDLDGVAVLALGPAKVGVGPLAILEFNAETKLQILLQLYGLVDVAEINRKIIKNN